MTKFISILTDQPAAYHLQLEAMLEQLELDINFEIVTDNPAILAKSRTQILLADPDLAVQVIEELPHLQWLQSTWAGNQVLLSHPRQDYLLTGVKDVFSEQMAEYALTHIFNHEHQTELFKTLQNIKKWEPPKKSSVRGKTLGILGFGNIAQGMVRVLESIGLKIVGLNRTGHSVMGFSHIPIEAAADKTIFATQCDYILNLLPDTDATQAFIDLDFVQACQPNTLFINAGRGTVINDKTLMYALDHHYFGRAVLDVFTCEPLPVNSPLWSHPNILITQHSAAKSQPEDIINIFLRNLQRLQLNAPLKYLMHWDKGY